MPTLEVDIGNTRIKWRLRSGNAVVLSSAGDHTLDLDNLFNLNGIKPAAVWVSVVAPSLKERFSQWSRHRLGIQPQYAVVTRSRAGVSNGYHQPSQMGVDRWLAMLAAFQLVRGACIVVDCGTACTIDMIAQNGQHKGGYIVPGLQAMSGALRKTTESLTPSATRYVIPPVPGKSTDEAITAGLSGMIIGLIEYTLRECSLDDYEPSILVTGGDGKQLQTILAKRLNAKVIFNADLVLEGLQHASFTDHG